MQYTIFDEIPLNTNQIQKTKIHGTVIILLF